MKIVCAAEQLPILDKLLECSIAFWKNQVRKHLVDYSQAKDSVLQFKNRPWYKRVFTLTEPCDDEAYWVLSQSEQKLKMVQKFKTQIALGLEMHFSEFETAVIVAHLQEGDAVGTIKNMAQ